MKHEHAKKKQNNFNYALFCSSVLVYSLFLSKYFTTKIVADGLRVSECVCLCLAVSVCLAVLVYQMSCKLKMTPSNFY